MSTVTTVKTAYMRGVTSISDGIFYFRGQFSALMGPPASPVWPTLELGEKRWRSEAELEKLDINETSSCWRFRRPRDSLLWSPHLSTPPPSLRTELWGLVASCGGTAAALVATGWDRAQTKTRWHFHQRKQDCTQNRMRVNNLPLKKRFCGKYHVAPKSIL